MFPIKDENPTFNRTYATYIIIVANVLSWFALQGMGLYPVLAESVCKYGLIPGELLGRALPGTRVPLTEHLACVIGDSPHWWTLLTSMFMHGGWFHIIGNMWFLFVFGDNVEDAMGPVRFIFFYLFCGLAAAAAQILSDPASPVPMVGASGAIGGVMGAYALLFPRAPVHMLVFIGFFFFRIVVPAVFMLGYWFLLQFVEGLFVSGASGGVAFWAHAGGFIAGLVLVRLFCKSKRLEVCRNQRKTMDRFLKRHARGGDEW
jgi:membrane associated rhomboid family serine protease